MAVYIFLVNAVMSTLNENNLEYTYKAVPPPCQSHLQP